MALLMAQADGHLDPVEKQRMLAELERMLAARGTPFRTAEGLLQRVAALRQHHAPRVLLDACGDALDSRTRQEAFYIALAVATADGHLPESEQRVARQLARRCGIDEGEVDRIFRDQRAQNQLTPAA